MRREDKRICFYKLHEHHRKFHRLKRHHKYHNDFHRYHRYLRYLRPVVLLINLGMFYLLFKWMNIKAIIFFIIFISIKEILHLIFLGRVEKRIFKPIAKLRKGVEEIAKGNYDVKIEPEIRNEIGLLIIAFNDMAQKLKKGEELQEEYEENRKNLIANISHDLKTPITSIQGYIEGILDGVVSSPSKVNKYLEIIYSNTTYVNRLINDLFLFSKLDMEKLDFEFEEVEIKSYMEDLMEEFKLELEEKGLGFFYHSQLTEDIYICMDRKRIYQAIRNIVGNAVKHGLKSNLKIKTKLYQEDKMVSLAIEDNGPGISKDKLPYIFDKFYRVDNQRTKNLMSTGLGLAISKELVEAHRGKIAVSSIEKQGSCFTISLPIALH